MVIENPVAAVNAAGGANGNSSAAHPSGIPQDKIDNIMSGIANTGDVKMNNHRKKLRQRFDIIKKLGQGTYGKVQLGINKETGQEVAIKTIKKCKIEAEADLVRIRREVQIMSSVQHPNIIHIYEVFENREKMVLVMEFAAGGELYDYLSERKVLNEEEARRIFRQVATAVYYCHKHKICHRDLKLENILLDEHGNAKIADFGLSNVFDDQRLLATFCGSPLYASPEIVEGTPYQGPEVDCWSLGVLLYTLVYGSMPFDGSNFKRLVKQISQGDYYEPKKPSRASTLIRDMLTVCPRKRATIEQICSHWWVNENDNVSCLELAEDLANQTPVRLDVLLSLTPAAVTADQLVVPSADGGAAGKGNAAMPRSHSVGSIRDIAANTTTEAERRILDMVAAGGEAALMPSPTRTITPAQSPVQTKRKLETTISMENAAALKKKEKAGNSSLVISESTAPLTEDEPMETEDAIIEEPPQTPAVVQHAAPPSFSPKDMELVGGMCEQLMQEDTNKVVAATEPVSQQAITTPMPAEVIGTPQSVARQKTVGKLDAVQETPEEKDATKVIKNFVSKHKTADLVNAIGQATTPTSTSTTTATSEKAVESSNKTSTGTPKVATTASTQPAQAPTPTAAPAAPFVRKCSLQDESSLNKFNGERRKSRILETAEKFQQMNAANNGNSTAMGATNAAANSSNEKSKKLVIPGVSVGSFKKEFEKKASNATAPPQGPTPGELRAMEQAAAAAAEAAEREVSPPPMGAADATATLPSPAISASNIEGSDSKNSVHSLSLEEARRSMENSIALLRQAQSETTKDVDQLCAKTESIGVSEPISKTSIDRERKLQNARAIIGNAIQPVICRPQAQPQFPQPPPPSLPSTKVFGMAGGSGGESNRSFGGYNQMHSIVSNPYMQVGGKGAGGISSGNSNGSSEFGAGQENAFGFNTSIGYRGVGSGIGNGSINSQPFTNAQCNLNPILNSNPHSHSHSHPNPNPNPNSNAAVAAARQNIIKHFATGVGNWNMLPQQRQQQGFNISSKAKLFGQQIDQKLTNNLNNHNINNSNNNNNNNNIQLSASQANAAASVLFANSATAADTATANNIANLNSIPKPFYNARTATPTSSNWLLKSSPGGTIDPNNGAVKTSTASITLKSATLPRRKNAKSEIQLDIKPRIVEQQPAMHFTTEMKHPVPDLRSAPPRDGPMPFSPIKTTLNARAASLEPKEHIIHIQRPSQMAYTRTTSNTTNRSGSLSRQSTNDSESDTTTTNVSQSTMTAASSQPIKKSPREFIIPIAVEGGGFITPREGSIEPSESAHTTTSSRSTFNRFNQRPTRRIGSLLSETGVDEGGIQFQKIRTPSINRDADEDGRFTLHRLRSSRPLKKISQDNDSNSSGEEDDDDGFEILTAENLFSTLLQRVRALTNRLNVNNDLTAGFPNSSRLLSSMRHGRDPFWNQEPFARSQMSYTYSETVEKKQVRLNNPANSLNSTGSGIGGVGVGAGAGIGSPWRHSMSRDLGSDMESMFSRTGATLPRGAGNKISKKFGKPHGGTTLGQQESMSPLKDSVDTADAIAPKDDEPLDLADLDLSRLRLSKKELETLSSITPGLPKCFQEQLLAKLPPTQARKLSRTLSMQNSPQTPAVKVYKRSQSGGRGAGGVGNLIPPDIQAKLVERCEALLEESEGSPVPVRPSSQHLPEKSTEPTTSSASSSNANPLFRRSLSRSRYDYESGIPTPASFVDASSGSNSARKSRSNSVCRDDYSKSLCSSYTSDVSEKYKYYSPYLSKSNKDTTTSSADSGSVSPYKRYSSVSPRESTIGSLAGRPPSGCLSPPPTVTAGDGDINNSSLRRRSTQQRRISRFLRPDFYDERSEEAEVESAYQREKKQRERETQSVLREIREKSREPSRERVLVDNAGKRNGEEIAMRKHSLTGTDAEAIKSKNKNQHVRNKSMELYNEAASLTPLTPRRESPNKSHRRSLSRSRNPLDELDTHALADKILQELQLLSAMRSEQEKQRLSMPREVSIERTAETSTIGVTAQNETVAEQRTVTVKKVKKIKPKEKTLDPTSGAGCVENPAESKLTTTVVKKVKKVMKKGENKQEAPSGEAPPNIDEQQISICDAEQARKESKLKRPKSYPTKEFAPKCELPTKSIATIKPTAIIQEIPNEVPKCLPPAPPLAPPLAGPAYISSETLPRESRLMRPKSYPASKLTAPKELKKIVTRSGAAIPNLDQPNVPLPENIPNVSNIPRRSVSEEKSQLATPVSKCSMDTSSSNELRPANKKIIKVTKKSKLMPPTPVTPTATTPTTATTTPTTAEAPKEWKEKSPEKKTSKGLFYAIGQKIEKLRDSAMNKEKKALALAASTSAAGFNAANKDTPDLEKPEKKSLLLKKKKSMESKENLASNTNIAKTEKTAKSTPNDDCKRNSTDAEKLPMKTEKRSRLDAMIRSLRERSVPRGPSLNSESNYIKRAVSVEEMPGTQNKNAVHRVLGLFKRFEKDGSAERRVRSTRSTSNIERQIRQSASVTSPVYQNLKEAREAVKNLRKSQEICDCEIACKNIPTDTLNCPECIAQNQAASVVTKRREDANYSKAGPVDTAGAEFATQQGNKEKRKGLMLDLIKLDHSSNTPSTLRNSKAAFVNGNGTIVSNGIYSNLPPYPCTMINSSSNHSSSQQSMDNTTNNNCSSTNNNNNNNNNNSSSMPTSQTSGYRTSSTHEINRNNLLTPSNENIANYSSDCSRSYQDDCASTSTFLSPTEEPELYFDNWSICSEDNYMLHATPSPTVSRLSRASQLSSPTRNTGDSSDPNESVIDRIKRRSFYCRFNEKKPKRTSSIVGPTAVRDYYRQQKAAMKAACSGTKLNTESSSSISGIACSSSSAGIERKKSPDITQEFLRPLKLSPAGTELKPPIYKSPYNDYTSSGTTSSSLIKPRKSLNDIRTTASPSYLASKHRYGSSTEHQNDYLTSTPSTMRTPTRYKGTLSSSHYDGSTSSGTGLPSATTSTSYYSTYNPKRRSSYTLNGILPSGTANTSSNIDSYATLGRRSIRPYDQRTISLLDPASSMGTSSYRRDARTPVRDYTTPSISRSNSRYRTTSSTSRSPTNI